MSRDFYADGWRTVAFGAYGRDYTIVARTHIATDVNGPGQPSAFEPGTVVAVPHTTEMAHGVIATCDRYPGWWQFYHHLTRNGLPRVGDRLDMWGDIGEVAWSLDPASPRYGGTLFNGRHVHLGMSKHPAASYRKVAGHRTLASFRDVWPIIQTNLAAPVGNNPKPWEAIMAKLDDDDKDWLRAMTREELGAALKLYQPITEDDKDWLRKMTRQELGGALYPPQKA